MSSSDKAPFWFVLAVSIALGLWTAYTYMDQKDLVHRQEQLASDQEKLRKSWARDRQEVEMLPSTLQLLWEQKCDLDFVALFLISELRSLARAIKTS
jgi:hypothetical protein